jgi:hypothetical protein
METLLDAAGVGASLGRGAGVGVGAAGPDVRGERCA